MTGGPLRSPKRPLARVIATRNTAMIWAVRFCIDVRIASPMSAVHAPATIVAQTGANGCKSKSTDGAFSITMSATILPPAGPPVKPIHGT